MSIEVCQGTRGTRTVASRAVDTWPYWRATTGRVHRVSKVDVVWKARGADYRRPRVLIHISCRSLWKPKLSGLTGSRHGEMCRDCFAQELAA